MSETHKLLSDIFTAHHGSPVTVPALSLYIVRVLALYCSLPAVRRRFPTADDIALASALESAAVPLVAIEVALFQGQLQRSKRDWEQGRFERLRSIGSLSYFVPLIRKARRLVYPEGTVEALARQLRLLETQWEDPGLELPAPEARRR